MNVTTLVAGGIVGAHGIGHVLGWLPALGLARFEGVSGRSWVFGQLGEGIERVAGGLLFALPTVGFAAVAAGLLSGQPWLRGVAVASAAVSVVATAAFPRALPTSSTVGSVLVNAAVLVVVLGTSWQPVPAAG